MQDPKATYSRYRVWFKKHAMARFIGHLDLQSFFAKAIKRAKLPVAYSGGFNPHQLLSIAVPLSLGISGSREALEFYLIEHLEASDVKDRLNQQMPDGIEILEVEIVPSIGKAAAALVHSARYLIYFENDGLDMEEAFNQVMKNEDISSRVFELKMAKENVIEATIATGSAKNLKPQLLIEHLGLDLKKVRYERAEIIL